MSELAQLLTASSKEFMEQGVFPLGSVDCPAAREEVTKALLKFGVVFITDAIREDQVDNIKADIVLSFNQLSEHYPQLKVNSTQDIANKLTEAKTATGIIAAKRTGMLFLFPSPKAKNPTVELDEQAEPVDWQPWYGGVNLKLLAGHPQLAALLGTLGSPGRVVSADSCKVANSHNPRTVEHIDHYSNAIERVQGCLHVEAGQRELGYLPNSLELLHWLKTNATDLFGEYGFRPLSKSIPPAQLELIQQHIVAPPKRSLALWLSGTVHGEQNYLPSTGVRLPAGAGSPLPHDHSVRLYTGSHTTQLPIETLSRLGHLAQNGIAVSRFHHNNGSRVDEETVCKGTTGPFNVCNRSEPEVLATKNRLLADSSLSNVHKQLCGVQQFLTDLPLEFAKLLTDQEKFEWDRQAQMILTLQHKKERVKAVIPVNDLRTNGFQAYKAVQLARQQSLE